jgi:hypothetical protein
MNVLKSFIYGTICVTLSGDSQASQPYESPQLQRPKRQVMCCDLNLKAIILDEDKLRASTLYWYPGDCHLTGAEQKSRLGEFIKLKCSEVTYKRTRQFYFDPISPTSVPKNDRQAILTYFSEHSPIPTYFKVPNNSRLFVHGEHNHTMLLSRYETIQEATQKHPRIVDHYEILVLFERLDK